MYAEWQYHFLYRERPDIRPDSPPEVIGAAMAEMCFTSPVALAFRDGWRASCPHPADWKSPGCCW